MDTPEDSPTEVDRRAAVGYLADMVAVFIYDRCVGAAEVDAVRAGFIRHLRALGVTDAEIEAWA